MSDETEKLAFDAAWYLAEYPDVSLSGLDPFEHYKWLGYKLGRRACAPASGSATRRSWIAPAQDHSPPHMAPISVGTPASVPAKNQNKLECFYLSEQSGESSPLSPLMRYIWKSRADLTAAFDCETVIGREAFIAWFMRNIGPEYGLPSKLSAAPVRELSNDGVNLIGYARTPSGRGEDVRTVAHALAANEISFSLRDISPKSAHPDVSVDHWIATDQPYRTNIFHVNADMFPVEVLRYGSEHYNIGYWAWELAKCPDEFSAALQLVDEVWGISDFVSDAFRARTSVPVHTMSLAVEVPDLSPQTLSKARFALARRAFTFLFTFDASSYVDRKNPVDVVRAFKRAFPHGDTGVQLVLKTHNVAKAAASVHASFLWTELLNEIGDLPNIRIIDNTLKRAEMFALTASCDAFVSLHRSEGFGRNLAEAMMYGRPVIATGYSGSNEIIRPDTAIPVEYSLVPVGPDAYPAGDGQLWAQPDVDHAAWAMQRLVSDEFWRNDIANAGQAFVRNTFNKKVIGQRYAERLAALSPRTQVFASARISPTSSIDTRRASSSMIENTGAVNALRRHVLGKDTVLFTIVSRNYLAFAQSVLQSVRNHHPEFALFICLVDENEGVELADKEDFQIVSICDIDLPNFLDMRLRYDVMELNTAVKPFFIDWVYRQCDVDKVIYFDPDLFLYSRLTEVIEPLDAGHSAVLTPHINRPIADDGFSPTDHSIMQSGVFNLGFIATRRCDETRRFIQWWAEKLETASVSDVRNNLFTDQRWCDFAPCFLPHLKILHHEGHNIAYWNLDQRSVCRSAEGEIVVNGQPLVFFHFSGFHPFRLEQVSKHQSRFTWKNLSLVTQELMKSYGERLIANGYESLTGIPYSYDEIDGLKIRPVMRQVYRSSYPKPHVFRSEREAKSRLVDLCLEPSDVVPGDGGKPLNRLLMQIYDIRPDVQKVFPLSSMDGAAGFRDWVGNSLKGEYNIDMETIVNTH